MCIKKVSKIISILFILLIINSCSKDEVKKDDDDNNNIEEVIKLPEVYINTHGQNIVDEPKIDADIKIIDADEEINYEGPIGIEIRGQSSQMFPKKQYGFETRDSENEDLSVSLLDFPEEEDWILHAPYSDKSLLRNVIMYDLSRSIGRYASRVKFVNLYLNNTYDGVYILMEKLKRDNNRIDINKLKDDENTGEDVTGGYILKIDKEDEYNEYNCITSSYPPNHATSNQTIKFVYDTPDAEDITSEQREYISTYLSDFEDALKSGSFADTSTGYSKYIDVNSFVDFFLLNEISNNVDGYRLSTWLVKDKNAKLTIGPIWDFNLAFGNADYCSGGEYDVWAYKFNSRCSGDYWVIPFWWERLLEDENFTAKIKSRWNELKGNEFSKTSINQIIDTYVDTLTESGSIAKNFYRWPVLDEYVWPNNYIGYSYSNEISYLKGWISSRLLWLDSEIANL